MTPFAPKSYYHLAARAIAANTESWELLLLPTCSCYGLACQGRQFSPEDYQDHAEAAEAFHLHRMLRTRYWGVHYRGHHVLAASGYSPLDPRPMVPARCREVYRRDLAAALWPPSEW